MTTPKRHHFVPQMILNGFTDPEGWLHWCHVDAPRVVRRARPAELFHRKHLYSTVSESGVKDPSVELGLSVLESEAVGVVQSVLEQCRAGRLPVLSPQQKQIWYMFFLMQWRRTPEAQRAATSDVEAIQLIERILDEVRAAVPHRKQEIDALSTDEAKARTLRNVRVQSLMGLSAEGLQVLQRRGIAVLRITQPNKSFIIGSRPVVKLTTPGQTNLNDPKVEMWLPIASDVALGVGVGDGGISLHHTLDDRPIRQLNLTIAKQSGTIAAGSAALVRSIAGAR